jgi:spore germination protein
VYGDTKRSIRLGGRGNLRVGLALVLALSGLLVPSAGRAGARQSQAKVVMGYYVPYDGSSWASLERHAQSLDMVAAQWVTIDACGNVGSRDDQTLKEFARERGVKLVPSLPTSSGWLNHQVLADDDTAAHAVEQIVNYTLAENYDGFDLDLEGVDPADRPYLTRFVAWLHDALHGSGKFLTLAIPAKERDVTVGWAGAFDYAALGASADLITIMAYEYRGPFSGPGSVAPYAWVSRVTAFATSQIPPEKVLLGLAFYGYDWNTTSGGTRALGYSQAIALAEQHDASLDFEPAQQSLTFLYSGIAGEPVRSSPQISRPNHTVTVRQPPSCDVEVPPSTPTPPQTMPSPGTPQEHEVWLEDSQSAAARLQLAEHFGAGGVATWRLGLEDPQVWPLFDAWRTP